MSNITKAVVVKVEGYWHELLLLLLLRLLLDLLLLLFSVNSEQLLVQVIDVWKFESLT